MTMMDDGCGHVWKAERMVESWESISILRDRG